MYACQLEPDGKNGGSIEALRLAVLVLWAMTMAPISHVAPARELATLVGTYFGSRLLKERIGWSRVVGALCIVLGVICLAATDS